MFLPFGGAVYMFTVTMFLLYAKLPVFAMILYLAVQSINIQYNTTASLGTIYHISKC